jgi:hypothetical protein
LEEEYRKYCGDENINLSLREKRKDQLIKSMTYHFNNWIAYANELIAVFSDKKAKIIGDTRLLKFIAEAMMKKDQYTEKEAE